MFFFSDKWDELTRFSSQQYQVLSLSLHYMEASDGIVNYLQKTESKLKGDIPDSVREKIKKENERAKV